MIRKNRIYILITLLMAGTAAFLVYSRSKSTLRAEISDFGVSDTASISRIFMADKNDHKVLLERRANGTWALNNTLDANLENINTLLATIANLKLREPVARAAHNNIIKLLSTKSVKVEIYQQAHRVNIGRLKLFPYEKNASTFYIGDATMDNSGSYALKEGADTPVIVYLPGLRGFVTTRFSSIESNWRVHTVFNKKLPDIKEITMEFLTHPEESFKVVNNNNQSVNLYRLSDNQQVRAFDTLKMMTFINAFRNIRYEVLVDNMETTKKDSIMNSLPLHRITLKLNDGTEQTAKTFGRKLPIPEIDVFDGSTIIHDRDRMYALVNNDKEFVIVQFFVFDKILFPLSHYTE